MSDWSKGTFLDFDQSYRKASEYCAVQDHSISEIQLKLKSWNVDKSFIPGIIDKLIDEGFLDEKRFALNYAGGKFRINGWGKIKITSELKMRGIQTAYVQEALAQIDEEAYIEYLHTILQKKMNQLGSNSPANRQKAMFFAASRGFEPALISAQLRIIEIPEK